MPNATSNIEYQYSDSFTYGTLICLGLAAAVGFLGNLLLVIIISKARKLRSVMNRFILHLAIGDLIVCSICIPLFLALNFYPEKSNHVVVCKIARFLQYLAPIGTIMLLITIGINRHQAIVHPLRGMTYRTANKLIFGAWLYSVVVVSPSVYLTNIQHYPIPHLNKTGSYCATIPVSTKLGLIYVVGLAFFGYVIPLITLLVLYTKISFSVWRRGDKLRTSRPEASMQRSRKKVIKMFLTVILVFVATWLPLIIYVGVLESLLGGPKRISYARLTLYAIGLSNSIYNPFIYSFFNKRFRDGCKSLFKGSVKVVSRKSAERREAVRERKKESYVLQTGDADGSSQPPENQLDWTKKFRANAVREHNDNAYESKDNCKLLTINEINITEEQFNSSDKTIENADQNLSSTARQTSTKKESLASEFKNGYETPNGKTQSFPRQLSSYGRKRKKAYKTLSIDSTLMKQRKKSQEKLRKTVSHDETVQWNNDFENIF
ncbi:prolactin-releasing peptide receptor [Exaiptasia diaphana]|uniref:G-protein coupled receptors family 1 profile domain-containing protein n=1 Tax=Exaiptasia diaphana TaxID=2652724 RepID=A0A913X6I5_EXADI|nr:prolactin-releasing peptide receptor [Exaiptasia diaphana]KXJ14810.1 Neuropeptide FF receptor 2 [Exaiptasia diaphana]